jgi:hypothetical protein
MMDPILREIPKKTLSDEEEENEQPEELDVETPSKKASLLKMIE